MTLNLKKKIGILLGTIFLITILTVIPSKIINIPLTTNKEVNENSVATLKTSSLKMDYKYSMNVTAKYNWIEINQTGTLMAYVSDEDDDSQGLNLMDIGFTNFKFFGREYEYLNVCSNGWMTFSFNGDTTDYRFINYEGYHLGYIPQDCNAPNMGMFYSSIFLFGSDMYPESDDGGIYYEVQGTTPNRHLIIEILLIEEIDSYKNQTCQVIFYENGDIKFQYKNTTSVDGFSADRTYPVIGLDNGDLIHYNNVSIDLLDFTNGVEKKAIDFTLKEFTIPQPPPLPTPDDDDDDDEDGINIGVIIIVIVLVSIGAGVAVIIVLIKKGIITIPKSR